MLKMIALLTLASGIYTLVSGNDLFTSLGLIVVGIAVSLAAFQSK